MDPAPPQSPTTSRLVFALTLVALALLAWRNRFIQDDAFISFRYAANLAHGHGLTWNPGERLEGYTNFLWTLILAVPIRFGIDPVAASQVLGVACFVVTLIFTDRLAGLVGFSRPLRWVTVLLLGTNYTFSAYATGGLETQLQACLITACAALALQPVCTGQWSTGAMRALSVASSAALLTRLDSAVVVGVLLLGVLIRLVRLPRPPVERVALLNALLLPLLLIVGAWLAWKVRYYGDLLPNTFYAKLSGASSIKQGLLYVVMFFQSYGWLPFLALAVAGLGRLIPRATGSIFTLALAALAWCFYVIKVGGDFMEFRFFVAILPILFVLLVWMIVQLTERRELRIGLMGAVLAGTIYHQVAFAHFGGLERVDQLNEHITSPDWNWKDIGLKLGGLFPGPDSQVLIATTAAGAIPYYSGLECVDMLGLNDRWVARQGKFVGFKPGHQRLATFDYLLRRGVNLVVGHPQVVPRWWLERWVYRYEDLKDFHLVDVDPKRLPENCRVVEIPLNERYSLLVVYLVQSPEVDGAITEHHLRTFSIKAP